MVAKKVKSFSIGKITHPSTLMPELFSYLPIMIRLQKLFNISKKSRQYLIEKLKILYNTSKMINTLLLDRPGPNIRIEQAFKFNYTEKSYSGSSVAFILKYKEKIFLGCSEGILRIFSLKSMQQVKDYVLQGNPTCGLMLEKQRKLIIGTQKGFLNIAQVKKSSCLFECFDLKKSI